MSRRLPASAILLEEAPVDRPELAHRLPAREPLGYLSAAQGRPGFAIPAPAGLRLALPGRPVAPGVRRGRGHARSLPDSEHRDKEERD